MYYCSVGCFHHQHLQYRQNKVYSSRQCFTLCLKIIQQLQLANMYIQSSHHGSAEKNLTRNHEVVGLIPGLAQCIKDPVLPWATVPIRPLTWELPHAVGSALEKAKRQKKKIIYIYIYIYMCVCVYIYIYIYNKIKIRKPMR